VAAMATYTSLRRVALLAAATLVLGSGSHVGRADWTKNLDADELELVGFAGHVPDSAKPKVTAYFPRQSYAQGRTAQLEITDRAPDVNVQMFRGGMSPKRITASDVITGNPVTSVRDLGPAVGSRTVSVHLGAAWASGLYYARLTAPGGRVGYATFFLRPKRLGQHSVAIVMPAQTWQACNFRDLGGNLILLSANNFFWKITIKDDVTTRVPQWRDLGRPEAALIGVEYDHNDHGEHRGPWVLHPAAMKLPWLVAGTGLSAGMSFSSGGIEADDATSESPKNVHVIAVDPESIRRRT
ncbi:MAG: N,N-dimethylformamidase beta subunit family domain-containing protein, partial [Gaiellaceae bacterium]